MKHKKRQHDSSFVLLVKETNHDPSKNNFTSFRRTLRKLLLKTYKGYLGDGFCTSTPDDFRTHMVCASVTENFLKYAVAKGNHLIRAIPH